MAQRYGGQTHKQMPLNIIGNDGKFVEKQKCFYRWLPSMCLSGQGLCLTCLPLEQQNVLRQKFGKKVVSF